MILVYNHLKTSTTIQLFYNTTNCTTIVQLYNYCTIQLNLNYNYEFQGKIKYECNKCEV